MRWILGGVLAVLAVVTAAVAVLVYLVPATAIERHALAAVSRATGMEITSAAPPDLVLFPSISMTLHDVSLRRPDTPGMTASVREARAALSWVSLLTAWTVDVTEVKLVEPVISFSEAPAGPLERAATPPLRKPSYPVPGLAIGRVIVEDGRIEGLGESWRMTAVDAVVEKVRLDAPMPVTFDMILNGRRAGGTVTLKEPARLADTGPQPISASLSSEFGTLAFDGRLALGGDLSFDGEADVATTDLPGAARWLGVDAPRDLPLSTLRLDGGLAYAGERLTFSDVAAEMDDARAVLSGVADLSATGPAASDVTIAGVDPRQFVDLPDDLAISDVTLRLARLEIGRPIEADVRARINNETVEGTARVPDPGQLGAGLPVRLDVALSIPGGALEFFGEAGPLPGTPSAPGNAAAAGDAPVVSGIVKLKSASARRTAAWIGLPLPQSGGFDGLEFDGDVAMFRERVAIKEARARLDETTATGTVTLHLDGKRPRIAGALTLDRLDTARYTTSPAESDGSPAADGRPEAVAARERAPDGPYELNLVPLKASLEAHLGATAAGGTPERLESLAPAGHSIWETAELGVAALRDAPADVDLDLDIGAYSHGAISLGKTALGIRLAAATLALDVREARPLAGMIKGRVDIDAAEKTPRVRLDLELGQIPVEDVVRSAGQRDALRGILTAAANLTASGTSSRALVRSLEGKVTGRIRDGAIVGYDVRRMMRPFADRNYDPRATTPFEIIEAEFAITEGVATSDRLSLQGPQVVMRAEGTANLVTSAIAYRTDLSLVPPPSNFSLPLKVLGTWRQIEAALDWARLATQWTGPSPFPELESVRPSIGDPELDALVGRLVSGDAAKPPPPAAVEMMRELTRGGR